MLPGSCCTRRAGLAVLISATLALVSWTAGARAESITLRLEFPAASLALDQRSGGSGVTLPDRATLPQPGAPALPRRAEPNRSY